MKTNRQNEAEANLAKVRAELSAFLKGKGPRAASFEELGDGMEIQMALNDAKAELAAANREAEFLAKNPPLPKGGARVGPASLADILGTRK